MKAEEILKDKRYNKYIVVIGVAGILLLFFSSVFETVPKEKEQEFTNEQEYILSMEKRLEELIGFTEGAGKTKLMITLENGVEHKYATEERNSFDEARDMRNKENETVQKRDSKEKNYIVIDGKNGREALIERSIEPKIRGVAVLCEGGDNPVIKSEIIQIVTTVLDIPSTKVSVSKIKSE